MKKIYYLFIWAALLAFSCTLSYAQPSYCLRLVQDTLTPTTVEVEIQMQFSTSSGLGSSNLQILYDNTRLGSPTLVSHTFQDTAIILPPPFPPIPPSYETPTVSSPTTSKASFNIELISANFGKTIDTAPDWTSLGVISFTHTGLTNTDLSWSYTGTTTETVAFDHNETDQIFATSTSTACLVPLTLDLTLPIELTAFEAQWMNDRQQAAVLNWTTATEQGNKQFDVQRSFDGVNWRTIGNVPGAGTTTEPQAYRFVDETVGFEMQDKFVYYRITQVDFSGEISHSEIQSLQRTFAFESVSVYPNPFSDELSVIIPKDLLTVNDGLLSVEDISGRSIIVKNISPTGTDQLVSIDKMTNLTAGVYVIKVETQTGVYSYKVIKH